MSLKQISPTEWEQSYVGGDGGTIWIQLEATADGLLLDNKLIPWVEIDKARNLFRETSVEQFP